MSSLKKILKKKKYIQVPLKLTTTNHFEVKTTLNGVTGRFILDTGASNTCVGFDKIEFFKLTSKDSEIKAAGAGATDMKTQIATKNKIVIGNWKKKKIKIVLFDLTHVNKALTQHNATPVDGIIGADILINTNALIDYKSKTLFLKSNK